MILNRMRKIHALIKSYGSKFFLYVEFIDDYII